MLASSNALVCQNFQWSPTRDSAESFTFLLVIFTIWSSLQQLCQLECYNLFLHLQTYGKHGWFWGFFWIFITDFSAFQDLPVNPVLVDYGSFIKLAHFVKEHVVSFTPEMPDSVLITSSSTERWLILLFQVVMFNLHYILKKKRFIPVTWDTDSFILAQSSWDREKSCNSTIILEMLC